MAPLEGDTDWYLEQARRVERVADLTDEELLALAAEACRQLDEGVGRTGVELFEPTEEELANPDFDTTEGDSMTIMAYAARAFCTAYDA